MVKQAVHAVRVVVRRHARRAVGSPFDRRFTGAMIVDASSSAPAWRPSGHRHRLRRIRGSGWAVPLATLGLGAAGVAPAWGSTVTNYTFHVPAMVDMNPCSPGDVVNLNGDVHVVITSTADNSGGFHMNDSLNSQLSGASITTGTGYVSSETHEQDWYAGAPFPTVHTDIHDFDVVSKSGTDNYVMHIQMHETVTAMGMPAANVDKWSMDCRG